MNGKLAWHKRFINFLKDVRSELKKVTWPAKNEIYGTTIIVIIAIFFFGFYLFFIDVIFSWLIAQIKSFLG
jgi:preprotein translocase subunit SecE